MRRAALVGLVVGLFAPHAPAQQPPYRAAVSDPEVKLRAGPSDAFPETGTLARGAVVIVEKEEPNGWLAVSAPYGSVSWIATQFIEDPAPDKATPKNVFVHAEDEVTLAAGKAGLQQPLDIRRVKVPNGTGLLLLGPKVTFAGKTWYPVAPPAGDVRYLPRTAVQFEKPAPNNFVVRVTEPTAPNPPPAVSPAPGGGAPLATVPGP
ncbi:MAG: SH3 domain-containing protein, partial [Planctomycetes bacterium]|nr:SH3 domain-containing protein [Planctomycetota bacterium]